MRRLALLLVAVLAVLAVPVPGHAAGPVIPLTRHTASDGRFLPIIEVSVNGSDPIRMLLDTGSNIVVTFPGAIVNPTTPVTNMGIAHEAKYTGTSATGTIALATVGVGGVATPQPIAFLDATSCTPDCLGTSIGAGLGGIFGIAQEEIVVQTHHLYSALAQLGGDLAKGYTVRLTDTGGTLELGTPNFPNSVTLPQSATGGSYPNGFAQYAKRVPACFVVEAAEACLGTTIDSGELTSSLMGAQFLPWAAPVDPPVTIPGVDIELVGTMHEGTVVGMSAGAGAVPFTTWTVGPPPFGANLYEPETGGDPYLNTGNQFFLGRAVGFDVEHGLAVIEVPGLPATGADLRPLAAAGLLVLVGVIIAGMRRRAATL